MMMMSGKRSRGEIENSTNIENMANFFMFLSRSRGDVEYQSVAVEPTSTQNRVYECKTCNRQFPSFQALGGHRASHKKPRLDNQGRCSNQQEGAKPKIHECSICGLQFAVGQALGGHMRKHRAAMTESSMTTAEGLSSYSSDDTTAYTPQKQKLQQVPVFKRSNSSRRILGVNLDLNLNLSPILTPTKDSNEFEFCSLAAATKQMSAPPMIYSFI